LKIFFFIEAKYVGTWNNGRRQGPGELHFNQYKYVGKFHENYVSILRKVLAQLNIKIKNLQMTINICLCSSSRKEKVNLYSKMDINKMETTI